MARDYRTWQAMLGPPWLQAPRGLAFNRGVGDAKDSVCRWCVSAVLARLVDTADEQALGYLGAERGLPRMPDEFIEAYRTRVKAAWQFWRLGGTRPGMQLALEMLGYTVKIIEHGLPLPEGQAGPDRNWWSEFSIYLSPGKYPGYGTVLWGEPHVWGEAELLWGTMMPERERWRIMETICRMKSAHSRPRAVWYSPRMHYWGEEGLLWGQEGLEWGMGSGAIEIPIPQGRMCEPKPIPVAPPAVGPRWGSGIRWGQGFRWGRI